MIEEQDLTITSLKKTSENEARGYDALFKLSRSLEPKAFKAILAHLNDPSQKLRALAAGSLGKFNDHRAISPLINGLEDPVLAVRKEAAFSLGQMRDQRSVQPLLQACKMSENKEDLSTFILALGNQKSAKAVPLLTQLLEETPQNTEYIAEALGQIGHIEALEYLEARLTHSNHNVRYHVCKAIKKIISAENLRYHGTEQNMEKHTKQC